VRLYHTQFRDTQYCIEVHGCDYRAPKPSAARTRPQSGCREGH
jgi:hypothetical protein